VTKQSREHTKTTTTTIFQVPLAKMGGSRWNLLKTADTQLRCPTLMTVMKTYKALEQTNKH